MAQVGHGEVAIVPTMKGFRRQVRAEVEGTERESSATMKRGFQRAGNESGAQAGRGFKRAFSAQSAGAGADASKKLVADVAKAAREVSSARLREQDAAGKVRVAEAQLAEARRKHAADSSQVIRAEERLAGAQRTLQTAQDRTRESSDKLAQAQKKAAQAASDAASQTTRGWSGVRGALGTVASGIQSAMSGAMSGIKRVASDAATFVQSQFKVAGAAITATVGAALVGGFNRTQAIENATARMRGLGFQTEEVAAAMQIASDAAMGTAFGMDELAGAAAMAMTNGIKPGQELIRYLDTIKGAATASGASVSEIGSIFGKVVQSTASGATITTELQQMADRQIPIWQKLSDVMGVPIDQVKKLASEGGISMDQFQDAVLAATGGMAASMNETLGASFRNMRSSLSRFGMALLGSRLEGDRVIGGLYPLFSKLFDMIKEGVNTATAAITPFMQTITDAFANKIGPVLERATEHFQNLTKVFKDEGGLQLPGLSNLTGLFAALAPAIGGLLGLLGPVLQRIPMLGGAFAGITGPLGLAAGALAALFMFDADTLASGFDSIASALPGMIMGVVNGLVGLVGTVVPKLVEALTTNVPVLLNGAVQVLLVLVDALVVVIPLLLRTAMAIIPDLIKALISMLPSLVQGAMTLFEGIIDGLLQIIPALLGAIIELAPGIITTLLEMLPDLLLAAIELFLGLVTGLVEAIPVLIESLVALLPVLIETLIGMVPTLIVTAVELFLALVLGLLQALPSLLTAIIGMLPQIVATLIGLIPTLLLAGVDLFLALVDALPVMIPQLLAALGEMGPKIIDEVMKIGPKLMDAGKALIDKLIEGVKSMFGKIGDTFGGVMDFVGGFFPASPAKRGKFSGSGWTQLGQSGRAIIEQFESGLYRPVVDFGTTTARLTGATSSVLAVGQSGAGLGPGDRLVIEVEGTPLTGTVKRVVRSEQRAASVRLSSGETSL